MEYVENHHPVGVPRRPIGPPLLVQDRPQFHGSTNPPWAWSCRRTPYSGLSPPEDLSEIQEEGAAILPTDLWIELKNIDSYISKLIINYDGDNGISEENFKDLNAMMVKFALLSRVVIGSDQLTEESIVIFSSKKKYKNLTEVEVKDIREFQENPDT